MVYKKIRLSYKNKKFNLNLKKVGRGSTGLIFRIRSRAKALLFEFNKPTNIEMSSLLVFFPFVIIWLDDKDKIIECRLIKPFTLTVRQKIKFTKLIEIPINQKYREVISLLVDT